MNVFLSKFGYDTSKQYDDSYVGARCVISLIPPNCAHQQYLNAPYAANPKAVTLLYSGEIIDDKQKQQHGLAQLK
jgi:hypothetical protein